jgi:hypothetical protein
VDTALNFATAVVIIDTLRQAPEGIGKNVNVVNSLIISTLKKMQEVPEDNSDDNVGLVDGVEEEKVADDEEDIGDEEEEVGDAKVVEVGLNARIGKYGVACALF